MILDCIIKYRWMFVYEMFIVSVKLFYISIFVMLLYIIQYRCMYHCLPGVYIWQLALYFNHGLIGYIINVKCICPHVNLKYWYTTNVSNCFHLSYLLLSHPAYIDAYSWTLRCLISLWECFTSVSNNWVESLWSEE